MKSKLATATVALALLATFLIHAPFAHADSPPPTSQRELAIERTLACPQCTDLPLDICDQDICNDMRSIIHEKVAAGESDRAIRQYFVDRYGARVLLAPPKDSTNLLAWLIPPAALLGGAVLTAAFLRAARRRGARMPASIAPGGVPAGYRARVEREVQEFE